MKLFFSQHRNFIGLLVGFYLLLTFLIWRQLLHQVENDRAETIDAAIRHNNNLVISLEQHTIRTIRDADAALQLVKMEYDRLGQKTELANLFEKGVIGVPSFDGLIITDSSGNVIMAYPKTMASMRMNVSKYKGFQFHKQHPDTLIIGKPVQSQSIAKTVIVLSRRLNDAKGNFNGTVAIQLQPSTFMSFYNQASMNHYDLMSLISPDGITYSRRTGSVESSGENISKSPLFSYLKQTPEGMYFANDAIYNFPTFFSYRKLKNYPIIATVGSREADVLARFRFRRKKEYVFGAAVSFLLLIFLLGIYYFFAERKKTTRILKKSEALYRSIFESSQDGILLLKPNGCVEAMNPAAGKMFPVNLVEKPNIHFTQLYKSSQPRIDHAFVGDPKYSEGKKEIQFTGLNNNQFIGELACSSFNDANEQLHTIVLVRDITLRKQMAQRLQLEQKWYQRSLTRQIIAAQEKERETLSHELHDNVNQILTTVKLYLESALINDKEKNSLISKSMSHLIDCIHEIRNLSHGLLPPAVYSKSLVESLESLVENVEGCTKFAISFQVERYHRAVGNELALAVYRIVQEQLNNIIKHAHASAVTIRLSQCQEGTSIVIEDDGIGFNTATQSKGIGLRNMANRVKAFNGKFSLQSSQGKGCRLQMLFPFCEGQLENTSEVKATEKETFSLLNL